MAPWLPAFGLMLAIDIVLLVLLLMSFPFVQPQSASYYLSLITLGIIVFMFVALALVIRGCRRFQNRGSRLTAYGYFSEGSRRFVSRSCFD